MTKMKRSLLSIDLLLSWTFSFPLLSILSVMLRILPICCGTEAIVRHLQVRLKRKHVHICKKNIHIAMY